MRKSGAGAPSGTGRAGPQRRWSATGPGRGAAGAGRRDREKGLARLPPHPCRNGRQVPSRLATASEEPCRCSGSRGAAAAPLSLGTLFQEVPGNGGHWCAGKLPSLQRGARASRALRRD